MSKATIDYKKAPAYNVLFDLGKKTMRPGGIEMTKEMLNKLNISKEDSVIELAPGRGVTTKMVMKNSPESYTAVERDEVSQLYIENFLKNEESSNSVIRTAQNTGLPDESASVVFGEAMLTMQTAPTKLALAKEAFRLLKSGGRYAIHETSIKEDTSNDTKKEMEKDLGETLKVGARPLTMSEWRELLEEAGFKVSYSSESPMLLMSPKRIIQDETFLGFVKFAFKVITTPAARRRILAIKKGFEKYDDSVGAALLIAEKMDKN